jgi:hypothetical protein
MILWVLFAREPRERFEGLTDMKSDGPAEPIILSPASKVRVLRDRT